jgi:hypothetical protein
MANFTPGRQLSRYFFEQAVSPIVQNAAPGLECAACLIGTGSEVLGFDDAMSSDHHWGPRVMLFVRAGDINLKPAIDAALREQLPTSFMGYPTHFSSPNPDDNNTQLLVEVEAGPVNHRVDIFVIREYLMAYLNFDVEREIEPADWLTFPEQKLRSLSSEDMFHDEIGLHEVLDRFAYYPHDVWLYLLASGWNRIGQEEHLMGRAGTAGDEIGSALIAARLVRDIMRLCFLMERTYAPYSKWFGTAFGRLACAGSLISHLEGVLNSTTWNGRESHLVPAYEIIATMHNALGITEPLPATAGNFFGRPFKVIEATGRFSKEIVARISDPGVKRIADRGLIGSIDQWSDSTDVLSGARWRNDLRKLYA